MDMKKGIAFSLDALVSLAIVTSFLLMLTALQSNQNIIYPNDNFLDVIGNYKLEWASPEFKNSIMDLNYIDYNYSISEQLLYLDYKGENTTVFMEGVLGEIFHYYNELEVYIDEKLVYGNINQNQSIYAFSRIYLTSFADDNYTETTDYRKIWIKTN